MCSQKPKVHRVQELSYRQQIAQKLRTQYADGIQDHRHPYYTVPLKYRLRVTQGHWKRNNWIDHIRLIELFDVKYYCDLEMWVRGH